MRILMIVPGGVHASGRVCVIPALLALIRRLSERHDVTVVALRQYPVLRRYDLLGARIVNLGYAKLAPSAWNRLLRRRRFERILDESRDGHDVVHAIWLDEPGSLGVLAGRRLGIPVVASLGGGEVVALRDIGYGGARYRLGRRCVRRVVLSASELTAGSRHAQASLRGSSWVPLFSEIDSFLSLPRAGDGPPWRLLHVGSINRVKDPRTLLEALEIVAGGEEALHLDWVGEDTMHGSIQGRAKRMGLSGRITFHGFQPHDHLPRFFARAHLYLQASRHESQGVAVCEAAAAGVAAVGTNVGILSDLAPGGAVAVPVGDPRALADAVLDLLASRERRSAIADAARAWAREHGPDWTASQFETIYARCVN